MERLDLDLKGSLALDDKGRIEGIAWPYKSPDRTGDIIVKGAVNVMSAALPMLRAHSNEMLIGIWDEVTETDQGLVVKGHFNETALARGVRSQIQTGRLNGLSIGFRAQKSKRQGRNRVITGLDLYEVSIVGQPSHPDARVTSVKTFDQAQALAEAINRAAAALTRN